MSVITSPGQISEVQDNTIIGTPTMINSKIVFEKNAKNNILFIEPGVILENASINFSNENALIILRKSYHHYRISAFAHRNTVLAIGKNNFFGRANIIVSEGKQVIIGDDGLISWGITIRVADPHLLYSIDTHKRINPSASVFIGDHVWIGQASMLLKGTVLGSGSILAATATISNKIVPSNTVWGGYLQNRFMKECFLQKTLSTITMKKRLPKVRHTRVTNSSMKQMVIEIMGHSNYWPILNQLKQRQNAWNC